jgi:hypothetical protein
LNEAAGAADAPREARATSREERVGCGSQGGSWLQRRNYATTTVQYYIQAVEQFAKHFHRPPDQLNQTHLREYQAYGAPTARPSRRGFGHPPQRGVLAIM